MGVTNIVIVLDSPVYYSGQSVSGKLIVDVDKSVKIRGIRLNLTGKAKVRWTEGTDDNQQTYASKEKYLESQQLVCGDYNNKSELARGNYVFLFNCKLPVESPSSFKGEHGEIKYSAKATVDIPWRRDAVAKTSFVVASVFDLNYLPVAKAPVIEQSMKTSWGQSRPLSMSVNLPVRGYVPGETMTIALNLKNFTGVKIKAISAKLHQNVEFHTKSKSRHWKNLITISELPFEESSRFAENVLHIKCALPPNLPPSYLQFCTIIDLRYHLTVTAHLGILHRDLTSSTEILIGNVPLIKNQKASIS